MELTFKTLIKTAPLSKVMNPHEPVVIIAHFCLLNFMWQIPVYKPVFDWHTCNVNVRETKYELYVFRTYKVVTLDHLVLVSPHFGVVSNFI